MLRGRTSQGIGLWNSVEICLQLLALGIGVYRSPGTTDHRWAVDNITDWPTVLCDVIECFP